MNLSRHKRIAIPGSAIEVEFWAKFSAARGFPSIAAWVRSLIAVADPHGTVPPSLFGGVVKAKQIQIRVTGDEHTRWRTQAQQAGCKSLSRYIRLLVARDAAAHPRITQACLGAPGAP